MSNGDDDDAVVKEVGELFAAMFFGGMLIAFVPGVLALVFLSRGAGIFIWLGTWVGTAIVIYVKWADQRRRGNDKGATR